MDMLEHSLRRQRDTMRALLEGGYLRHPLGRWAWRQAQAHFLLHQLDRIRREFNRRVPLHRTP